MKVRVRNLLDSMFTLLSGVCVAVLVVALAGILGPMMWRGASAVLFRGTVEWRKMQLAEFGSGNQSEIEAEAQKAQAARRYIYETIDEFKRSIDIDTEAFVDRARKIHREFGQELRYADTPADQYTELRSLSRQLRDKLEAAFESQSKSEIQRDVNDVLQYKDDERLQNTAAEQYFNLAMEFRQAVAKVDLDKCEEYAESLQEVEDLLDELFGPRPGEPLPILPRLAYGATRWDLAESLLDRLLWAEKWVQKEPGEPRVKVRTLRAEQFAGTRLEPLFTHIERTLGQTLKPRWTFYWRYFIHDQINSHYFGGIGPEILGTFLLTVLGMLFVIPLGVISAAYLVECASDNFAIRIIRLCINTLAGVPSIVFGLFGLAFFVLYLFPVLRIPSKPCILAASMTLAILTLPVMIRASEEAIRGVPKAYKEASLALGASRFRTFVTVTLPAALPGILTGVILSLSRIAGETAPILFTGAVALGPTPDSLFDPTRTLSYGSYDIAVGDRLAMMVPHKQYGMVVTLVLLILCLNGVAIVLRSRVFRKLKGQ
jgi:phosphate transport system permease protein